MHVNSQISRNIDAAYELADALLNKASELADIVSTETNRAYRELSTDSIPKAAETIKFFANTLASDRKLNPNLNSAFNNMHSKPLGVVGSITPWNDPPVAFAWKVVAPLIVGNSVLWKPSEYLRHSSKVLLQMSHRAGFDKLEIYGFSRQAGAKMVTDVPLDCIAFTGSTNTAVEVMRLAFTKRLVRTHVEAGGAGIAAVGNVKDISKVAATIAKAAFYNQGQVCSKPSRIFVKTEHLKDFLQIFSSESNQFIPSISPRDHECSIGGLITVEAKIRVQSVVRSIIENRNVDLVHGDLNEGFQTGLAPIVLFSNSSTDPLNGGELFAPIVIVHQFDDWIEVYRYIAASPLALENGIFSNDIDEIKQFVINNKSGLCSVNTWGSDPVGFPFGGNYQSGYGIEKSRETLQAYQNLTHIYSEFL